MEIAQISCPAILVSAPASGQGKTLVTAALAYAWRNRGLNIQAFKCGPDFIDSMILQVATGRPVYNLDLGMCGLEDGKAQLYRAAENADAIIIEGVMGLYDGKPSSADIAETFGIPVALTIDASGMAQTFAAIADGLYNFNHKLLKAGVIANKVGSLGHANMLQDALSENIPWFGALVKNEELKLPERHLGLHLADEIVDLEARIKTAAIALEESSTLPLPPSVTFEPPHKNTTDRFLADIKIAIAQDAAFCFIYQANIDCLQAMGAQLEYFSPLDDTELPEADAYWLPGGYPELHLTRINQNIGMRNSLHQAAATGKPILAECGGMMALGQSLNGVNTFGLLQGTSEIQPRLQGLGTQHLATHGGTIGAHTFHYGKFDTSLMPTHHANGKYGNGEAVYMQNSITASFLHFYFPSNPKLASEFFIQ